MARAATIAGNIRMSYAPFRGRMVGTRHMVSAGQVFGDDQVVDRSCCLGAGDPGKLKQSLPVKGPEPIGVAELWRVPWPCEFGNEGPVVPVFKDHGDRDGVGHPFFGGSGHTAGQHARRGDGEDHVQARASCAAARRASTWRMSLAESP